MDNEAKLKSLYIGKINRLRELFDNSPVNTDTRRALRYITHRQAIKAVIELLQRFGMDI